MHSWKVALDVRNHIYICSYMKYRIYNPVELYIIINDNMSNVVIKYYMQS